MKPNTTTTALLATLVAIATFIHTDGALAAAPSAPVPNTEMSDAASRNARMQWWREARFGMFIHWGLYALPAGHWNGKAIKGGGEWILKTGAIPVADYAKLTSQFNPEKYDADQWVRIAKDAGMKYIVITAKHHDGFALWPSKASSFNITSTPFPRDPLQELVAACRRHGIRIGFYYSQNLDWTHPGGGHVFGPPWDPVQKGDSDKYVNEIVIPQVREILSNYGKIDVLWWDMPGGVITAAHADRIYKMVKELQPDIIMNNRLGGSYQGDTETPELKIPAKGFDGRDWETCMTMNRTWGFKKDDHKWKSTTELIRMLSEIASKGGNFLLNVGPTAAGEIPPPSIERLAEVGAWMKINHEAIYGTSASPFEALPFKGYCTQKPGKLYLHVCEWPKTETLLVPLRNKVKKAYLLSKPADALATTAAGAGGVRLTIPAAAPDPHVTVIVLEIEGLPEVAAVTAERTK
jgi:alpha-L-fucosidase